MVTTLHTRRTIISGAIGLGDSWGNGKNNANEIINPTYVDLRGNSLGAEGRGAVRGIRIRNLEPSGWYVSGFQQLRLILDNRVIASGTMRIPYDTDRGQYLNLSQFVLGADYHEDMLVPGSGMADDVNQHVAPCDWCTTRVLLNGQRVPFHHNFRLQGRWIWRSGWRNGFVVDVWYELKE